MEEKATKKLSSFFFYCSTR